MFSFQFFKEKETEILYLQSELESIVQEKSTLKFRLYELERNLSVSQSKSLQFEAEKNAALGRARNLEVRLENLRKNQEISNAKRENLAEVKERIAVNKICRHFICFH